MQHKEFERLKSEIERDYREAVATAESEREKNLAALERVWKLAQRFNGVYTQDDVVEGEAEATSSEKPESLDSVIDAVRDVLELLPISFTFRDVLNTLAMKYPNAEINHTTISGTLKRLQENGEIYLKEAGSGRRPSFYTTKQTFDDLFESNEAEVKESEEYESPF